MQRAERIFCVVSLVLCSLCARAQHAGCGLAYCDLDHLYDTVPALFYDDADYTPQGRLAWDAARYNHKIRTTAALLDSLRMPLVALWGVETEAVARDISAACNGGYTYLHRTLNSLDGMDFALFYYGDRFFPLRDEPGRRHLYVEGVLLHAGRRDTVGLVLCSEARMAEWVVRDLREERPGVRLIVAGRTAFARPAGYGLQDVHERAERSGRGNVRHRTGWSMRDRILVDTALHVRGGDVFARRYLVDQKTGDPVPTYTRRHYRGGQSYALPVYVYFE